MVRDIDSGSMIDCTTHPSMKLTRPPRAPRGDASEPIRIRGEDSSGHRRNAAFVSLLHLEIVSDRTQTLGRRLDRSVRERGPKHRGRVAGRSGRL